MAFLERSKLLENIFTENSGWVPLITEKNKATSALSFRRQQLLLVLRFIIQKSAPLQAHIWIWNVTGHITKARVTRRNKVRVTEGRIFEKQGLHRLVERKPFTVQPIKR